MSFVDHLEILRGHILRSVLAILAGGVVIGIFNEFFIKKVLLGPTRSDFPTYGIICRIGKSLNLGEALCMTGLGIKMQSTSVAGQFSTFFSVVLIGGIIIAFPYIFWEFWRFVRPALTKKRIEQHKRRHLLGFVSFLHRRGFWLLCDCTLHTKLFWQFPAG